jgi:PAS domain S-box-containing protein
VVETHGNLAVILDHVGDGVTVQDPSGRLVYVNASAARSLGFASAAEVLATPLPDVLSRFAFFDEKGQPFPLERLPGRRALAGEEEPSVTVRYRVLATGEERWSIIRASPVFDSAGNVLFAVNAWQDVTVQKRSEAAQRFLIEAGEALASSLDIEATLANIARLAVPHLADWCAVHLVQDDGTISQIAVAHADPERLAWARWLQEHYPAEPGSDQGVFKVIRTGVAELVPEVSDEMLTAVARDAEHLAMLRLVGFTSAIIMPMIARERSLGAITLVTAESRHRYTENDLGLARELARRAALAVDSAHLYDAERTARAVAEEARARFRAVIEGVPDAILVAGEDGSLLEANAAACSMLGYGLHDLLALRLDAIFADPDAALTQHQALVASGEWRTETGLRRRDDAQVPVETWWQRLDLPAGPIDIGVLRDISERLAADQVREEVLAAIAHDLRNPLSSIKLHAQMLQRLVRRSEPLDPARLDESLTAINTMTTRVTFLLEDIVDVARTRDGEGIHLTPEPTDLVPLAQRCAAEAGTAAARAVVVVAPDDPLIGAWDPRAIERVVLNLLNNALKYSPAGGAVTVRVAHTGATGDWALLEVTDEGIGIPVADLPRIFDRYRRGRNVGRIGGTGLGLTGAKQMVERHGGNIVVSSEEGRGTKVTVLLPLEPAVRATTTAS